MPFWHMVIFYYAMCHNLKPHKNEKFIINGGDQYSKK